MKDISTSMKTLRLKKGDIGDRNIYGPIELASFVGVYFFLYSDMDIARMQCQLYDSDDGNQWHIVPKSKVIDRPVNNEGHGRVISYIGGKKFLQIESTIPVDAYAMFKPDAIPTDGDFTATGQDTSTNVPVPGGAADDGYDHTKLEKAIIDLEIMANAAQAMANAAGEAATSAKDISEEAQSQAGVAIDTANEAKTIAEGLQGKIDLVQETAGNAKAIAQEASKDAEKATENATNALAIANDMNNRISDIRTVANIAEIKAEGAKEAADSVVAKADDAVAKAQEAKDDLQSHIDEVADKFPAIDDKIDSVKAIANKAKEDAENAQDTANDAKEIANNADNLANANAGEIGELKTSLTVIEEKADNAKTIAENAQIEATTASNTASEAKVKAQEVEETANTAKDAADNALTAASAAAIHADNAVTLATEAKSLAEANETNITAIQATANTAKTAADNAVEKADSVKAIADNAVTIAGEAQSHITEFANKIEDMEGVASGASTLAGEAKEEALSAKALAQSIETKADQGISDAATAQGVADEAKILATSAQTAANAAAQTAADAAAQAETSVQTDGDQEIGGVKTFTKNPLVPNPVSDPARNINPLAVVPLAYIQSLIGTGGDGSGFDEETFKAWIASNYLSKSGGEMTGPLIVKAPSVSIKSTDDAIETAPDSTKSHAFYFLDKAGAILGEVSCSHLSDGAVFSRLTAANRKGDGTALSSQITVNIHRDGTAYSTSPHPRGSRNSDIATMQSVIDYAAKKLAAPKHLYVNSETGSDTADLFNGRGESVAMPFATLPALFAWANASLFGPYQLWVHLLSDASFDTLTLNCQNFASVVLMGNDSVRTITCKQLALANGALIIGNSLKFQTAAGCKSLFTIWGSSGNPVVRFNDATEISGSVSGEVFSLGYAGRLILDGNANLTGDVAGKKYTVRSGGSIFTGGKTIPGTEAGTSDANSIVA